MSSMLARRRGSREAAARFLLPVVTVAIASALTMALPAFLEPIRLFFFWCAVLITAAIAGTGAAVGATLLAALMIPVAVFEPIGSFTLRDADDLMRVLLFIVFTGGIGIAVGTLRTQYQRVATLARDREEALTGLRTSELTYRALAEVSAAPQAVWTSTADGRINWSDDWLHITGQTRAEAADGGLLNVLLPEDAARTERLWRRALKERTPYDDEVRVRVRGGRHRWFAIRAVPVIREGVLERWVGVIADVHERRRRQEEAAFINRATAVLASSLNYEKTLRDLARLCVPALADWCTIDIVRDGESYVRFAVEHVDPDKVKLAFELDATRRPAPEVDPIAQVMKSGASQVLEDIPDEVLARLARDARHLEIARGLGLRSWIMVPMQARGRIMGVLTLVCAESQRRFSEDDLPFIEEVGRRAGIAVDNARLYDDAQQANRAKDEFLATLSHELRTPLTTILGWSNMLQLGGLDPETSKLAVDTIVRSATAQGKLIEELLDLSRIVAGKLTLAIEPVDLVSLLRDGVNAARPAAESKRIDVRFEHPPQPLFVRGDARRLSQVAWNLLGNAMKFTPTGGTVTVRLSVRGNDAAVEVSDTGSGIDPSFLPHVWERFRQADSTSSRHHGGLGLGLAVVRYLVEAHGGAVEARSPGRGAGATFIVRLPLFIEQSSSASPPDRAVAQRQMLAGRRLLVIDDDPDSRVVIATMLRQFGADVRDAGSSDEALALLQNGSFDLVLTDLAMPSGDGFVFLEKARATDGGRHLPIVALSALGTTESRARALAAGFDGFLSKPIEAVQLAEAVTERLRA